MATALNREAWSTTAASNSGADSTIGTVADGSAPTDVDGWVRSIMAAEARAIDDQGGALTAGGTANALTVTTTQVLDAAHVTTGLRLLVKAASANTSATVTFAPDSLTARNIKRSDGSALAIGSITVGMGLDLMYVLASTEWFALNIPPLVAGASPSARASFSAAKSANQNIATTTETLVTFTESDDIGGLFASSLWTPPAGVVLVGYNVAADNVGSGSVEFRVKYGSTIVSASTIGPLTSGTRYSGAGTARIVTDGATAIGLYAKSSADTSYDVNIGASAYEDAFWGTMI